MSVPRRTGDRDLQGLERVTWVACHRIGCVRRPGVSSVHITERKTLDMSNTTPTRTEEVAAVLTEALAANTSVDLDWRDMDGDGGMRTEDFCCPVHGSDQAKSALFLREDGHWPSYKCLTRDCELSDLLEMVGLSWSDVCLDESGPSNPKPKPPANYLDPLDVEWSASQDLLPPDNETDAGIEAQEYAEVRFGEELTAKSEGWELSTSAFLVFGRLRDVKESHRPRYTSFYFANPIIRARRFRLTA